MFTTQCFIRKNTPELRNKLLDMGYRQNIYDTNEYPWLAVNHNMFISVSEGFECLPEFNIDCGDNEELFLAIAALRDDTDKYQQFVCIESYCDCFDLFHDIGYFAKCITDRIPDSKYWRKATAEEIIEHFNKK